MKYYLYGLQRSGTNVVQAFLEANYNIEFMNNEVADRTKPNHKHFRLYDEKNIIPLTDKNTFYNRVRISSLEDLDTALGDTTHTNKYVVVYKNLHAWLPSIEKWARKFKWKTQNKINFVADYLHFMKKWDEIKVTDRVLFVSYESFLRMDENNFTILNSFSHFLKRNIIPEPIIFTRVRCSDTFTTDKLNYYLNKKYMDEYTEEELRRIEAEPLFSQLSAYQN